MKYGIGKKHSHGNAMTIIGICVAFCFCVALLPLSLLAQQTEEITPVEQLKTLQKQARDKGAKGQLPMAWRDVDGRIKAAEKSGISGTRLADLQADTQRLYNMAVFVDQMRERRSGLEAMLGRFDQALFEIATMYAVEMNPVLSGSEAAEHLLDTLTRKNLRRQVLVDSLMLNTRQLSQTVGGRVAAQESLITSLQVEVSSLRQQLWETQLRANVAEDDRSTAESVLQQQRQRDDAISSLGKSFSAAEGEVFLTPDGQVVLRVYGMPFAVGSAALGSGQSSLVAKIVDAVKMFPGATVQVEGHTDGTGSRQANLRLSRRRAETVARLLEEKLELTENSIEIQGYGPDRPIALNNTDTGRAKNRRIDVVFKLPY